MIRSLSYNYIIGYNIIIVNRLYNKMRKKLGRTRIVREKETQKEIMDYLRNELKIFCWKNNSVGIYRKDTGQYIPVGMRGISDIIGLLPTGQLFAVEVKSESGRLTEDQIAFMVNITHNKGIAIMTKSLFDVKNYFGAIMKPKKVEKRKK